MQAPLQHRDHCAEAAPDNQVAQQENPRWDKGAFLLARLRFIVAKIKSTGAAEGTIIAAIMMIHMVNIRAWDAQQSAFSECCMSHAR
jgi:hypothetical protein